MESKIADLLERMEKLEQFIELVCAEKDLTVDETLTQLKHDVEAKKAFKAPGLNLNLNKDASNAEAKPENA